MRLIIEHDFFLQIIQYKSDYTIDKDLTNRSIFNSKFWMEYRMTNILAKVETYFEMKIKVGITHRRCRRVCAILQARRSNHVLLYQVELENEKIGLVVTLIVFLLVFGTQTPRGFFLQNKNIVWGWNWTQNMLFGQCLRFSNFVAKNQVHIGIAFHGFSYQKSTRKELS